MRTILPALIALLILAAACGGDDAPAEEGAVPGGPDGPIETATPLAQVPEPTIVSGGDTGAGTIGGGEGDTGGAETYTVEPGDSLLAIAERYGVPVEAIQAANDLDGFDIFVGDVLTIPRQGGAPEPEPDETADVDATPAPADDEEPAEPEPTPAPGAGGQVHIVESGDTPLGIAFQYDVTLEALEAANGGPGSLDNLQIGQEVIIP